MGNISFLPFCNMFDFQKSQTHIAFLGIPRCIPRFKLIKEKKPLVKSSKNSTKSGDNNTHMESL